MPYPRSTDLYDNPVDHLTYVIGRLEVLTMALLASAEEHGTIFDSLAGLAQESSSDLNVIKNELTGNNRQNKRKARRDGSDNETKS